MADSRRLYTAKAALKRRAWARKLDAWLEWLVMPVRFRMHAWRDSRLADRPDGFPVPPPRLRYRVHGAVDQESFLAVGLACATDFLQALDAQGIQLNSGAEVLDFGCGCGRVLRKLLTLRPTWSYTGVDVDDEAIRWCREAYPAVHFLTTPPIPPTAISDVSFDLVVAISVFTHLDEESQNLWLNELHRLVRPGAYVLISALGEREQQLLPAEDQALLRRDGILHKAWRTGRLKLDGLPEFYQSTYHTPDYVARAWTAHFQLVRHIPNAINRHQDLVILRRP